MKYFFTAVLAPRDDGSYECRVPDIPHCVTSGQDLGDALHMIEDCANLMLTVYEDKELSIPEPSSPSDYPHAPGEITTLLALDTDAYRKIISNISVRKSVSIPAWMDEMAQRKGISLSNTLQTALRAQLSV